jgi:hypothetical protein
MKIKKFKNLTIEQLNALYLNKQVIYKSLHGKIINIAYYKDLGSIPYAELELRLSDCRTKAKMILLTDVVLVVNPKIA